MNRVFYQNNTHSISAKILLDVSTLTEDQIANILKIAHIKPVCFDLRATSPIKINDKQFDVKINSISVNVSDSFRHTLIRENFDFCISNQMPNNAGRTYFLPLVNYNDFMELIRLILVHNNQYYLYSDFQVDNFIYLHGRSNYLFPTFQKLWSFAVRYDTNRLYLDTLDSVANRFKQLIIAFDECSYYCFENRGANSINYAIYYFDSFVSQLASIFGNLANTTNYFYDINVDNRKVDLRTSKGKEFLNKLNDKDPVFCERLENTDFQNFLNLVIKPLRNDIEHNNIPQGVNSKNKVSMILSDNTWNLLQSIINKYPQECSFNPNHFDNKVYLPIYPVLKFLLIFGRKYINYVIKGFDFHWKFRDISKLAAEDTFHPEPNPIGKGCETSLYFTTYWLPIERE